MKQSNIENFREYCQFTSLKDLNNNVEMFLADHKSELSKGEYIAFRRLTKFMGGKVYGICNAKIGTIVSATHEKNDMGGISRSTFKRMKLKLKDMGLLSVFPLERQNGSKSSNLYVLNRYDAIVSLSTTHEPSEPVKVEPSITSNLSKTNNIKDINKRKESEPVSNSFESDVKNTALDHTYCSSKIPKKFVDLVKIFNNFPNNFKIIERFWSKVEMVAWKFCWENEHETKLEVALDSYKQLIRKQKVSNVRDTFGYFYGILNKKFNDAFYDYAYSLLDEDMAV